MPSLDALSLPLIEITCPSCRQTTHLKLRSVHPALSSCNHCKAFFVYRPLINVQLTVVPVPKEFTGVKVKGDYREAMAQLLKQAE